MRIVLLLLLIMESIQSISVSLCIFLFEFKSNIYMYGRDTIFHDHFVLYGAVFQWEKTSLARKRLWVRIPSAPPLRAVIQWLVCLPDKQVIEVRLFSVRPLHIFLEMYCKL